MDASPEPAGAPEDPDALTTDATETGGVDIDPDQVPIPALMRAARGTYSRAIRRRYAQAGLTGLPRNAPHLLGGMGNWGSTASEMLAGLGGSEESKRALVETLVSGGYLSRPVPGAEPIITEVGMVAAAATRQGIADVDAELALRLTPEQVAGLRAGLFALCDIRDEWEQRDATSG